MPTAQSTAVRTAVTAPRTDRNLGERSAARDHHFLSRLQQRGDSAITERALRLYRDPKLVSAILQRTPPVALSEYRGPDRVSLKDRMQNAGIALVPNPEERVAIELAPGEHPPTIIVDRSGQFVTCLAPGMRVGPVAVVRWERAEQYFLIDAAKEARRNLQKGRRLWQLERAVEYAGFGMTREEFVQIGAVAPLLWKNWATRALSTHAELTFSIEDAARVERLVPESLEAVEVWRRYHALAHYILLSSLGGKRASINWFDQPVGSHSYFRSFFQTVIAHGEIPLAARALWYVGRSGRYLYARARGALLQAEDWATWRAAALSLLMIGGGHKEYAPFVIRDLSESRAPGENQNDNENSSVCGQAKAIRDMAHWAMRRREDLSDSEVNGFRAWAGEWCRAHDSRLRPLVDSEGMTTLDFACRLFVNTENDFSQSDDLIAFLRAMPFIGSMSAEEFFHPASEARLLEHGCDVRKIDRIVAPCRVHQESACAQAV